MMTFGQRIKARREEMDMSQDTLAKLVGYKSRSSINKIELGLADISQSRIMDIATALNTTPSYLMGWKTEWDESAKATERDSSSSSDYDSLFLMNEVERELKLYAINTYTIHGSQGKNSVTVRSNIPKDKYILVGDGEMMELTESEYSALQSVLAAMRPKDKE